MACLFQVATRHETLADKQSLAPSTFLTVTVEISGVKHAIGYVSCFIDEHSVSISLVDRRQTQT
jgi:predicted xylose isomerase-like sugar epimerase